MTEQSGKLTKEQFARVGVDEQASENLVRPSISYWQDAFRRLKKNKVAMASLVLLLVNRVYVHLCTVYLSSSL